MKKNNKKGFTLVELVIVVAVMAILVAVAIPTVKSITGTAKTSVRDTNARTIESLIKLKEAELTNNSTGVNQETAITAEQVIAAVNAGKLGIEKDNYYYVLASSAVVTSVPTGTAGTDYYIIGFDANGTASGTAYSGQ